MNVTGTKRRSRFEAVEAEEPELKKPAIDISAAAARAAELSREVASKIAMVSSLVNSASALQSRPPAAETERKPAFRPLMLDSQGREIDEYGNVVKSGAGQLKTLAANLAVEKAIKKKENPYLAHRAAPSNTGIVVPAVPVPAGVPLSASVASAPVPAASVGAAVLDERLHVAKRDLRGRKGLHFIEAGTLVDEAERIKVKEERKIIAGYASGRKALQQQAPDSAAAAAAAAEANGAAAQSDGATAAVPAAVSSGPRGAVTEVPPYPDAAVPALEWWDEAFLPKERRDARRVSKAAHLQSAEDIAHLALQHARTYKLVQHPVPVRPLGVSAVGERPAVVLPMYLTKQERKKLRRTSRQERELEKRDKMMMGLIPAPEPKFKLSNFMKVLGDQAVADPSLVEARVLQQMQKRVLNHEMRNQAAKLTPQERREKKLRKRQEDTSRSVSVAVLRVKDFANLKHRFKVDVNAQQYFLSGIVLLCPEAGSLVVAEGGPKGVRKFVRLMTERINWTEAWAPSVSSRHAASGAEGYEEGYGDGYEERQDGEGNGGGDSSSDSSDDDEEGDGDKAAEGGGGGRTGRAAAADPQQPEVRTFAGNRCDLLWQGLLPKRVFTGFKFQESQDAAAARKLLKARGVGHYWDMVEGADANLAAAAPLSLF